MYRCASGQCPIGDIQADWLAATIDQDVLNVAPA
jgi:hypothetical protein